MSLKSYRGLHVWQKAMDLVVEVYHLSAAFPEDEKYGLRSQIHRAVVSVPSNIAEGYGRLHQKEYLYHLSVARGSLAEVETQLILSARLKFVARKQALDVWNLSQEVGKMLSKLIGSLEPKQD